MSDANAQPQEDIPESQPLVVRAPSRSAGRLLLVLLNLLLLAGIAGLAWMFLRQEAAMSQLVTDYNALAQQTTATESRLAVIETAQNKEQLTLQDQSEQLGMQQAAQVSALSALRQELAGIRLLSGSAAGTASRLGEAEAMLRLARERLLSARETGVAISLYLATDELLKQLDDPSVQAVRLVLARELDSLRAVTVPDITSLYAELGTIRDQLDALPLAAALTGADAQFQAPQGDAVAADASWFDTFTSNLSKYFVLTQRDAPVQPKLSVEGSTLIRQSIALQLEEARLALLQGETRLYQAALDAATSGISEYLEGQDKAQVLAALQRLRASAITITLPPVGSTLDALRSLSGTTSAAGEPQP